MQNIILEGQQLSDLGQLLTIDQAAMILQRKKRTLHYDIKKGRLPYIRLFGQIRFRKRDLDDFIDELAVPARAQ